MRYRALANGNVRELTAAEAAALVPHVYVPVAESPEPTPVEFPEPEPAEVPQSDPIDVPPPAGPTDPEVPDVEFQPSARITKAGKPDRRYRKVTVG